MKKIFILSLYIFAFSHSYAQKSNDVDWAVLGFFDTIEGIWEGTPSDSSFVSVLEYNKGKSEYFVFVNNELLSQQRNPFSHYEGIYFFNPDKSRIEFTTLNNDEIHSGYCKVSADTLYHYATVRGVSAKIKAYSSAIVKIDNQTIAYYASYSTSEKIPDLEFKHPLIYRKLENQNSKL